MTRYCPRCGTEFDDRAVVCWPCHARLVDHPSPATEAPASDDKEEGEEEQRVWVDLRPVYRAPDEFSALAVQRVLADAEIESRVRSVQIPWADGLISNIKGYWGEVLVPAEDVEHARELVSEYLKSIDGDPGSHSDDPAEG
jgi:hypothetical protein